MISVENNQKQNNIYSGILATLVVLYVFDLLKKKIRPHKSVNVHKSDYIVCVFHVCLVFCQPARIQYKDFSSLILYCFYIIIIIYIYIFVVQSFWSFSRKGNTETGDILTLRKYSFKKITTGPKLCS